MSDILCVTSRNLCREDFLTRLERIAAAGPTGVILREKDLPPEDYRALAEQALALCRARGVPCILHSFPEIAEALGERAIHLPLPLLRALPPERRGAFRVLGTSCHSVEDAREAEKLGCTAVCRAVDLPVWAIGGITPENFPSVRAAGARGGCVMSGLMTCADPAALLERFARRD